MLTHFSSLQNRFQPLTNAVSFRGREQNRVPKAVVQSTDSLHFSGSPARGIMVTSFPVKRQEDPAVLLNLTREYSQASIANIEVESPRLASLTIDGRPYEFMREADGDNLPRNRGCYLTQYGLQTAEWLPYIEWKWRKGGFIPHPYMVTFPKVSFYLARCFPTEHEARKYLKNQEGSFSREVIHSRATQQAQGRVCNQLNSYTMTQDSAVAEATEAFFKELEKKVFTPERLAKFDKPVPKLER